MKKGFTLIELLAVIVILAVIALIAVPIVIKIIGDAKDASNMRSVEQYLKAAQLSIANKNLETPIGDGACSVKENADLDCDGTTVEVQMKGTKPVSGVITFSSGKIVEVLNLKLANKYYNLDENGKLVASSKKAGSICKYEGELAIGTEVTCGTESFYVINNSDEDTVTLLSKYNLNVGYFSTDNSYIEITNENPLQSSQAIGILGNKVYGVNEFLESQHVDRNSIMPQEPACDSLECYEPSEPPYSCTTPYDELSQEEYDNCDALYNEQYSSYLQALENYNSCQSELCIQKKQDYEISLNKFNEIYGSDDPIYYGYWWDINNSSYKSKYSDGTGYPYVYDNNSTLYKYVDNYGKYLSNIGLNVIESRIPNGFEINNLPDILVDARKTYIWDYIEDLVDINVATAMTDEQIESYSDDTMKFYFDYFNYPTVDRAKVLLFGSQISPDESNLLVSKLYVKSLTSYWLGNVNNYKIIGSISEDGTIVAFDIFDAFNGIRPVIVVKREDL